MSYPRECYLDSHCCENHKSCTLCTTYSTVLCEICCWWILYTTISGLFLCPCT